MITEDEHLERVVAFIQAATTVGAEIQWNEKIEGRQFDVAVQFRLESLRYLAIFEVKNKTHKTPAEALDAFVTKARDQKANKMVLVSASGFQAGALTVARRERRGRRVMFPHVPRLSSPLRSWSRRPHRNLRLLKDRNYLSAEIGQTGFEPAHVTRRMMY